jgi:hypothetical protein
LLGLLEVFEKADTSFQQASSRVVTINTMLRTAYLLLALYEQGLEQAAFG